MVAALMIRLGTAQVVLGSVWTILSDLLQVLFIFFEYFVLFVGSLRVSALLFF